MTNLETQSEKKVDVSNVMHRWNSMSEGERLEFIAEIFPYMEATQQQKLASIKNPYDTQFAAFTAEQMDSSFRSADVTRGPFFVELVQLQQVINNVYENPNVSIRVVVGPYEGTEISCLKLEVPDDEGELKNQLKKRFPNLVENKTGELCFVYRDVHWERLLPANCPYSYDEALVPLPLEEALKMRKEPMTMQEGLERYNVTSREPDRNREEVFRFPFLLESCNSSENGSRVAKARFVPTPDGLVELSSDYWNGADTARGIQQDWYRCNYVDLEKMHEQSAVPIGIKYAADNIDNGTYLFVFPKGALIVNSYHPTRNNIRFSNDQSIKHGERVYFCENDLEEYEDTDEGRGGYFVVVKKGEGIPKGGELVCEIQADGTSVISKT